VRGRRWWEHGTRTIEDEARWYEEDGLDFTLDPDLFDASEAVVFQGELRLGERRCPARVIYPTSYGADGHPVVLSPELPVHRHRSPSGALCLDHRALGETRPMCGAEAVLRAERLWELWENDREKLAEEEADAPDPAANYYQYQPDSGVVLIDVELEGAEKGFFTLAADQISPLHGAITSVRVSHPAPRQIMPPAGVNALLGATELTGPFKRVGTPPPFRADEWGAWLGEHHEQLVNRQLCHARDQGRIHGMTVPALVAFVYPDEGPGRGETHDAWLLMTVDPSTRQVQVARTFHVREVERWLRQPQLAGLAGKRIAVIGAGALGSQGAALLARAGTGYLELVDFDIVTHGNRVRHELDLRDAGRTKVLALARRVTAINPWIKIAARLERVGGAWGDAEATIQVREDELLEDIVAADLVINTSADGVTGKHISRLAAEAGTPVVHGWVSAGAWGARILVQRPGLSGCWNCLALAQAEPDRYPAPVEVPAIPSDPDRREVSERGCADPTFTGPGFEVTGAAAALARIAVGLLLDGSGDYPPVEFDLATLNFRDAEHALPGAQYTSLPVHPDCEFCGAGA
jgi:molybdopterin/thiamine biosynthesis adenylyltransferase